MAPAVLALIVAASALVAAGHDGLTAQVTFASRVDVVRLDVLVTDRGRPVLGLTPAAFEVRDNGVLQRVDFVSFDEAPVNTLLVVDLSQSVAGVRLGELRRAGQAAVAGMRGDDKAGLVTFSHVVLALEPPTRDRTAVSAAIDRARAGGVGTALRDAAHAGLVLAGADDDRPVLVVFSDGLDTSSWLRAEDVLAVARRSAPVVYGVVSGRGPRNDFLHDQADATGGRVLQADAGGGLETAFLRILDEFRHRYVVGFRPSGVAGDGWHRVEVRLRGRRGAVRARPGYQAASGKPPGAGS
jgi:VWFA-related protein